MFVAVAWYERYDLLFGTRSTEPHRLIVDASRKSGFACLSQALSDASRLSASRRNEFNELVERLLVDGVVVHDVLDDRLADAMVDVPHATHHLGHVDRLVLEICDDMVARLALLAREAACTRARKAAHARERAYAREGTCEEAATTG